MTRKKDHSSKITHQFGCPTVSDIKIWRNWQVFRSTTPWWWKQVMTGVCTLKGSQLHSSKKTLSSAAMAGSTRTLRRLSFSNCGLGDTKFQILVRPTSTRNICIHIDWCSCTVQGLSYTFCLPEMWSTCVLWFGKHLSTQLGIPTLQLYVNEHNKCICTTAPFIFAKSDRSRNPSGETGLKWKLLLLLAILDKHHDKSRSKNVKDGLVQGFVHP